MRKAIATLILLAASTAAAGITAPGKWLEDHGRPPVDYLVSSFDNRRIVIVGEAHWIRHDPELIAATIPRLPAAGVHVVAVEMFPSIEQERIDRLVSGETWSDAEAISVLRAAAWPYRTSGVNSSFCFGPLASARGGDLCFEANDLHEGGAYATPPRSRCRKGWFYVVRRLGEQGARAGPQEVSQGENLRDDG